MGEAVISDDGLELDARSVFSHGKEKVYGSIP